MRNLLDTVTIHVRSLKSLGLSELSYATMLVEILTKVIPKYIVVEHYMRQSSLRKTSETQSSETELQPLLDHQWLEVEARNNVRDTPEGRRNKRPKATPTVSVLYSESNKTTEANMSEALQQFWRLDSIATADSSSNDDQGSEVARQFTEKIAFKNGRYEVALPWKRVKTDLADNRSVAVDSYKV
ncbi:hypothetical protein HPB52_005324 [Rhipicephalus sanguineus]|uniref:Uncharacterized protein n=1 Tax=Rhipicephalus sanguineus TaxID=34632 RepID=A0A9D4SQR2_RHISA|nr:hypothetical protein HPB52_005324 [Rhipicephalus sanguineus]